MKPMKLNKEAAELLDATFQAQGRIPINLLRVTDIKKCKPGKHKKPQLLLRYDGQMKFRCDDCMKDITPTRWKVVE